MRDIEAGLKAHLGEDATTVCSCWRVALKDGTVLGFTEHDHDLSFASTTFLAASGFTASNLEMDEGLAANTSEVAGGFSSVAISEEALAAGRYDGAWVETYLVNWRNPAQHQRMHVHEIGEVTREGGGFTAELRSVTHRLSQPQGRSFSRRCDAVLGDGRCGFNLETPGYAASGTVVAVNSDTQMTVSLGERFADGFFSLGVIAFESGALAGLKADVESNRGDGAFMHLELWLPLENMPSVGDVVRLTAGCDKAFQTCRAKFANHLSFRGFPHIPGVDFAYSYVNGESEHDGQAIYK